ncbi:hypothetical protein GY45DRAFT_1251727, partial [Cubamyces sp. BRFM 1775]
YYMPFLDVALPQMPRLRALIFTASPSVHPQHMIGWSSIQRILSLPLPNLAQLAFDLHWIASELLPGEELALHEASIALRSFQYTPYRELTDLRGAEAQPYEARAVKLIAERSRDVLERLALPMHSAPLDLLCSGPIWPNLRELRLKGEYRAVENRFGAPVPYVLAFANMPRLRVLALELAQPEGVDPQPLWPANHPAATWPWPDLTELAVSCPQVDDRIYRELPRTLRSLSLQYSPHYTDYVWMCGAGYSPDVAWQWPLLNASEMLRVLRQCRLPALRHLSLEYLYGDGDGDGEGELLNYIARAFPGLTSLELLRCHRRVDGDNVREVQDPLERICRPLQSLDHLRALSLHLDLVQTPSPFRPAAFTHPYDNEDLRSFYTTQHEVADRMAVVLGPELEEIKLWRPHSDRIYDWRCYEVVRSSDFGTYVR